MTWLDRLRMSQVNQRGQICMRAFAEIERLCERHSTLICAFDVASEESARIYNS